MKNTFMWIGIYLLICILTSVIENIISTIFSVIDYKRVVSSKGRDYSIWSLINVYFIILGKSFVYELKDNNYHDWLALISLFILWPVHLFGWILAVSVPKMRKKYIVVEYRDHYKDFDAEYYFYMD